MSAYRVAEACPRCGSDATTTREECRACGHVWGAAHACVHCGVVGQVLPALGSPCRACGVPRVVAGWTMPVAAAARVRNAFAKRRRSGRIATAALGLAVVCMPLGLVSGTFTGWLAILAFWFVCLFLARAFRRAGRAAFSAELLRVEQIWHDEEAELGPRPEKIRIAEAPELLEDADPEAQNEERRVARVERGI